MIKTPLLAAALAVAIATPAAAAGPIQTFGNWMLQAGKAQKHFFTSYDKPPTSQHCRYVVAHPNKFGTREVKFCKGH